jgi:hypothetical protein
MLGSTTTRFFLQFKPEYSSNGAFENTTILLILKNSVNPVERRRHQPMPPPPLV